MMKSISILLALGGSLLGANIRMVAQQNGERPIDGTTGDSGIAVAIALPTAPEPKTGAASREKPAVQKEPYTVRDRFGDYLQSTFEPTALIFPAISAGYQQWNNFPREWQQGGEGYGRRLLSAYGGVALGNTISFGVAALDGEDLRYVRSAYPKKAIFKRTAYAIAHTFISPLDGGGHTFAWSRVAGDYGAGFLANEWYPAAHSTLHNAAYLGTFNFAADLGSNILREFIRPHWVWGPQKDKKP